MNKCVEHLAFIDKNTGKIKERFEVHFKEETEIEGRRKQLCKKTIKMFIEKKYISSVDIFEYMKKTDPEFTKNLLLHQFEKGFP